MKKIVIPGLLLSSLCLFGACSDDASESIADKCANGLSEECLVGTWKLDAIKTKNGAGTLFDYSASPSTLTFTDDGKFTFTFTTSTTVGEMTSQGCAGTNTYGTWDITGAALKITMGRSDCHETGTYKNVVPTINEFELNLTTVVFHTGDLTDSLYVDNAAEVFTRVAE